MQRCITTMRPKYAFFLQSIEIAKSVRDGLTIFGKDQRFQHERSAAKSMTIGGNSRRLRNSSPSAYLKESVESLANMSIALFREIERRMKRIAARMVKV